MDEKSKSIWKKSRTGWGSVGVWLVSMAATFVIVWIITCLIPGRARNFSDLGPALVSVLIPTVVVGLWLFIRCFFDWRKFRRLLFGVACLATLLALVYAEEDWRGWHAWNRFKREWEARGEHFDFASVIPKPVPDDQNFALTPVVASSYEMFFDTSGHELRPRNTNVVDRLSLITWRDNHWARMPEAGGLFANWPASKMSDLKPWQEYFRSPPPAKSTETNSFPITPQPQSPAGDVLLALSKYDSAIEEIRQAGQLPESRFPLTYGRQPSFAILLPHLGPLRSCALTLTLRALAELQTGRTEPALADVLLSWRVANAIRTEPFLISHVLRIAMLKTALQPVYEGLAEHRWTDAQLVALDAELAGFDFPAEFKLALRGEAGLHSSAMDLLRGHWRELSELLAEGNSRNQPPPIAWLIPSGWFYQNQFRLARVTLEYYLPAADENGGTFSPAAVRNAEQLLGAETKTTTPYNYLERLMLPAYGASAIQFAEAQASVDLARTALALERYRLVHGEFPESLDPLAPRFIAKVPHDVIGGQPLKYRRTEDGQFVLYSIGWNEKDDGGVVVLGGPDRKSGNVVLDHGDWVWRYPEKPETKN